MPLRIPFTVPGDDKKTQEKKQFSKIASKLKNHRSLVERRILGQLSQLLQLPRINSNPQNIQSISSMMIILSKMRFYEQYCADVDFDFASIHSNTHSHHNLFFSLYSSKISIKPLPNQSYNNPVTNPTNLPQYRGMNQVQRISLSTDKKAENSNLGMFAVDGLEVQAKSDR